MSTVTTSAKVDKQAEYCNIPQWHNNGYTGKGVGVWNCEGFTDHGKISRKRILQAAPEANVFSGNISSRTKNGIYTEVKVMLDDGNGNKTPIPVEEFIEKNNIRILNASFQPTPFQFPGYKVNQYWKDLIDKYNLCIFCSSGNDRKKEKTFDNDGEYLWYIGALNTDKNGLPKRAGYSNGGEGLDFADFTGDWAGTSFSSPYLAGKTALVLQRYPNMKRMEVYEYLKKNCDDLGDAGADNLYGNGLFKMPEIKEKTEEAPKPTTSPLITTTKILVNGLEKVVKRVVVDNENYIRLRDFEDVLGICDVEYDEVRKMPVVTY